MHIVEFTAGSLRFVDAAPERAPDDGFVWIYLDRTDFVRHLADVQAAAQRLGGSALLDVHVKDLASDSHPSHYDATSVYDMVIFRRLATLAEVQRDQEQVNAIASYHAHGVGASALTKPLVPEAFSRIDSRAVGFAIFDKLLISVHPAGCYTANSYVQRFVADAKLAVDTAGTRNRVPQGPSDLVLRTINTMVDSYLDLRKDLATALENAQAELLKPDPRQDTWSAMMHARRRLHALQDLCEEQQDAMQEWLDTLRELPLTAYHADPAQAQARRDQLVARARRHGTHRPRAAPRAAARAIGRNGGADPLQRPGPPHQRHHAHADGGDGDLSSAEPVHRLFRHEFRAPAADPQHRRHVGRPGPARAAGRRHPGHLLAPALFDAHGALTNPSPKNKNGQLMLAVFG